MKFGLLQEAETPLGTTHADRYHELVKEVVAAEEAGFDFWGGSEQHFNPSSSTVSSPLLLYSYIASKTQSIKLRSQIVIALHKMNHPIRIAEQAATLDILSKGRFELGIGRGNNPRAIDTFEIDARDTRKEMLESIEIIGGLLTNNDIFEYRGETINVPPTRISPRPYSDPMFPIYLVATSAESHEIAGNLGVGCINFDNWLGIDTVLGPMERYKEAIQKPKNPVTNTITNEICWNSITAYCAPTKQQAIDTAGPIALSYLGRVAANTYGKLAGRSKDYAYMAETGKQLAEIHEKGDVEALMERTPTVLLGDPDFFIERIKTLESLGFTEVTLRVEGMGHEKVLEAIKLIGRYVIPEFRRPNAIARQFTGHEVDGGSKPGRIA